MKDFISIVVPIYKVPEKNLRRCIESLINQTYKELEIILIDDGSPDMCGKICDEYQAHDERIKVIHQKNKGLCETRNVGINSSTSKWIVFVDGDDFAEKYMCEELIKAYEDDIDIVCAGYVRDNEENQAYYKFNGRNTFDNKYKSPNEIKYIRGKLLDFNGNIASIFSKLISKELIVKNNIYFDEKLKQGAEALEFNFRLFQSAKGIKILDKYLYHYMYSDDSITLKHDENNHYMVLKCFEKIKEEIEDDEELLQLFYNRMKYVIVRVALRGYFSEDNKKEKYRIKKKKYLSYLSEDLVIESLENEDDDNIDKLRKLTLYFIKKRIFWPIIFIAKYDRSQKKI